MITQEQLKDLATYEDGRLLYIRKPRGRANIGDPMGTPQPNGYSQVMISRKRYYLHQLVYLYHHGYIPREIDHADRDKSNNRIENLRESNRSQNMWNKDIGSSASGYRGVIYLADRDRWKAYINHDGKQIHIGHFKDKHSAARAYNEKAVELRGEYAVLNEIQSVLPEEFQGCKHATFPEISL